MKHRTQWWMRMAWRDSRHYRLRLVFFILALVIGIGALVSIRGIRENVFRAIDLQSKALLGADLEVSSRQPFADAVNGVLDDLGGERVDELRFSTMAYFESSDGTRLVQVRAIEEAYPFYGSFDTQPEAAASRIQEGKYAVVEESLMLQFEADVGDWVKLGEERFQIAGVLEQVPGESALMGWVAPRIFIASKQVESTGLLGFGSRVYYRSYFKLDDTTQLEERLEEQRPLFREHHVHWDTVRERQEELGEAFGNMTQFLSLIGFVALVLGGVGMTSAIQVYLKLKTETVAVLRCLGAKALDAFMIYLIQVCILGLIGSVCGIVLGTAIQWLLPPLIEGFLPFELEMRWTWGPVLYGLLFGTLICVLFALLPLLPLRKVSPFRVLRASVEHGSGVWKDPWLYAVLLVLLGVLAAFTGLQSGNWALSLGFLGGLLVLFGLLALAGWILLKLVRKFLPRKLPFSLRHGLSNLHRPNNRTVLMVTAMGLGFVLIMGLLLVKESLLKRIVFDRGEDSPNMVFFDIQPGQLESMETILEEHALAVLEKAPLVSMRLLELKGRPVRELVLDKDNEIPRWTLQREYRSTYRGEMTDAETLVAGEFVSQASLEDPVIPVTVEQGLAEDMGLEVGDRMVFDIQGLPLDVQVSGIREVDWNQVRPNFFVVFPEGVLEEAPGFFILATHSPDVATTAAVQSEVVRKLPNVSAIDLRLILDTLDDVLGKVGWVIQFMALFAVIAGLLVMASSLITNRYQRVKEAALLRTLGASSQLISRVLMVEYLGIGAVASLVGSFLAMAASWTVAKWVFQVEVFTSWLWLLLGMLVMMLLTLFTGWITGRGIAKPSPLQLIRDDNQA